MLFELRNDLFPEGRLTDAEVLLWSYHFERQKTPRTAPRY
jgi:hypothetical protein